MTIPLENPMITGEGFPDESDYWGIPIPLPPGAITIPLEDWSDLDDEDRLIQKLLKARRCT